MKNRVKRSSSFPTWSPPAPLHSHQSRTPHTSRFACFGDFVQIDGSGFKWITVKELSAVSDAERNFGCRTTRTDFLSPGGFERLVEVFEILFRSSCVWRRLVIWLCVTALRTLFDTVFSPQVASSSPGPQCLLPPQQESNGWACDSSLHVLIFQFCRLSPKNKHNLHRNTDQELVTRNYTMLLRIVYMSTTAAASSSSYHIPARCSLAASISISHTKYSPGGKTSSNTCLSFNKYSLAMSPPTPPPPRRLPGSPRCLSSPPAGFNLSQKNRWCTLKLMPEDRRSQTKSHHSPLGHFSFFFKTRTHYFSHLTEPLQLVYSRPSSLN